MPTYQKDNSVNNEQDLVSCSQDKQDTFSSTHTMLEEQLENKDNLYDQLLCKIDDIKTRYKSLNKMINNSVDVDDVLSNIMPFNLLLDWMKEEIVLIRKDLKNNLKSFTREERDNIESLVSEMEEKEKILENNINAIKNGKTLNTLNVKNTDCSDTVIALCDSTTNQDSLGESSGMEMSSTTQVNDTSCEVIVNNNDFEVTDITRDGTDVCDNNVNDYKSQLDECNLVTKINDKDLLSLESMCKKIQDTPTELWKINPLQLENYNQILNNLKDITLSCKKINDKILLMLSVIINFNSKNADMLRDLNGMYKELVYLQKRVYQQLGLLNNQYNKKIISLLQTGIIDDFETVGANIFILTMCTQYLKGTRIFSLELIQSVFTQRNDQYLRSLVITQKYYNTDIVHLDKQQKSQKIQTFQAALKIEKNILNNVLDKIKIAKKNQNDKFILDTDYIDELALQTNIINCLEKEKLFDLEEDIKHLDKTQLAKYQCTQYFLLSNIQRSIEIKKILRCYLFLYNKYKISVSKLWLMNNLHLSIGDINKNINQVKANIKELELYITSAKLIKKIKKLYNYVFTLNNVLKDLNRYMNFAKAFNFQELETLITNPDQYHCYKTIKKHEKIKHEKYNVNDHKELSDYKKQMIYRLLDNETEYELCTILAMEDQCYMKKTNVGISVKTIQNRNLNIMLNFLNDVKNLVNKMQYNFQYILQNNVHKYNCKEDLVLIKQRLSCILKHNLFLTFEKEKVIEEVLYDIVMNIINIEEISKTNTNNYNYYNNVSEYIDNLITGINLIISMLHQKSINEKVLIENLTYTQQHNKDIQDTQNLKDSQANSNSVLQTTKETNQASAQVQQLDKEFVVPEENTENGKKRKRESKNNYVGAKNIRVEPLE